MAVVDLLEANENHAFRRVFRDRNDMFAHYAVMYADFTFTQSSVISFVHCIKPPS